MRIDETEYLRRPTPALKPEDEVIGVGKDVVVCHSPTPLSVIYGALFIIFVLLLPKGIRNERYRYYQIHAGAVNQTHPIFSWKKVMDIPGYYHSVREAEVTSTPAVQDHYDAFEKGSIANLTGGNGPAVKNHTLPLAAKYIRGAGHHLGIGSRPLFLIIG